MFVCELSESCEGRHLLGDNTQTEKDEVEFERSRVYLSWKNNVSKGGWERGSIVEGGRASQSVN